MNDSETTLFRHEVYAARRDQWLGCVAQAVPIPRLPRAALALVVTVGLAVFLLCVECSRNTRGIRLVAPRATIESPRRITIGPESGGAEHRSQR